MSAELGFHIFNVFAFAGWLALAAGLITNNSMLRDRIAGLIWPGLLALAYVVVLFGAMAGVFGDGSGGGGEGFGSLPGVMRLFTNPWVMLGAWIHYLAFDLFVGTRIAQEADRDGVPKPWLILVLPLTFLFGPAGYLLFILIRPLVKRL